MNQVMENAIVRNLPTQVVEILSQMYVLKIKTINYGRFKEKIDAWKDGYCELSAKKAKVLINKK